MPLNRAQPNPEAWVAYRSSGSVGSIGSTTICLYDSNTDGRYTLDGDTMRTGPPGQIASFMPIPDYFATQDGIFKIESLAEDGSQLKYSKYTGPAGKLDVSFAAGSADCQLAFTSRETGLSAFVATRSKGEVPVIPGSYQLGSSVLTTSNGQIVGIIVPQTLSPAVVAAGAAQKVQLGAPLALEFAVQRQGRPDCHQPHRVQSDRQGG